MPGLADNVQVSTEGGLDDSPSMARGADGRLFIAYNSKKTWETGVVPINQMKIWIVTSEDDGVSWTFFAGLYDPGDVEDYVNPVIAISTLHSRVHVAYERAVSVGQHDVYVATLDGSGALLNDRSVVSSSHHEHSPSLAAATGDSQSPQRLFMACQLDYSASNTDVVVYKSLNAGTTWSLEKTFGAATSDLLMAPSIDVGFDASMVVIAFAHQFLSRKNIEVYARRNDVWDAEASVVEQTFASPYLSPKVAVDSSSFSASANVAVAYRRAGEIRHAYSTDSGRAWTTGADELVRADGTPDFDLLVFGGRAFLTYVDDETVWFRRASFPDLDVGDWSTPERVSEQLSQDVQKPSLVREPAADETEPAIAWMDDRDDQNLDVFMAFPPYILLPASIRGTVVDQDTSSPLKNVSIWLFNDSDTLIDTKETDRDGEFLFEDVAAGNYRLHLWHRGYFTLDHPEDGTFPVGYGEDVDRGTIELLCLDCLTGVEGNVVDMTTGLGVADADVELFHESDEDPMESTVSDEDGYFKIASLAPGNYYLVISAYAYISTREPTSGVFVVRQDQISNRGQIEIVPLRLPAIVGTIKDQLNGDPVEEATVTLVGDGGDVGFVLTDAEGLFLFQEVPPGCYHLRISGPEHLTETDPLVGTFCIEEGEVVDRGEIGLMPVREDGVVRGVVTDEVSGQGAVDATVELYTNTGVLADTLLTAGNGFFQFEEVPPERAYYLWVKKAGYVDTRDPVTGVFFVPQASVEIIDRGEITIELAPTTGVRGVVKDSLTATIISGADVILLDESESVAATALSDANGVFLIQNIDPGNYFLLVGRAGYEQTRDPEAGTFAVVEGQYTNRGEILLARVQGSSITGIVEACETGDPLEGAAIELRDSGGALIVSDTAGNAGEFALLGLDAGDYYLLISATGYDELREPGSGTFSVAGNEVVDLGNLCLIADTRGDIVGQLADRESAPVGAAEVSLNIPAKTQIRTTTSQSNGSFGFDEVSAGGYFLWTVVNTPEFATSFRHPVEGTFDVDAGTTTDLGQVLVPKLESIASLDARGTTPVGIAWDGEYFWMSAFGDSEIYQVHPATGEAVHSIGSPGPGSTGLAFDGTYLWNADSVDQKLYKLDPVTGESVGSLNALSSNPRGLDYDGSHLWYADPDAHTVFKIDPASGTEADSFFLPDAGPQGVVWNGKYLYVSDGAGNVFYEILTSDGSVSATFRSPGILPRGMTWTGAYIWHIDANTMKALKLITGRRDRAAGDVDGDGAPTIMDAYIAAQAEAGIIELSCVQEHYADVDGSGGVSIVDAFRIALAEAGVIVLPDPGLAPCH